MPVTWARCKRNEAFKRELLLDGRRAVPGHIVQCILRHQASQDFFGERLFQQILLFQETPHRALNRMLRPDRAIAGMTLPPPVLLT